MPVHIFKAERNTIFYKLLKEGVICCKKEFDGVHKDTTIDNLKVWMLSRSLHSKGYLDLTFSWQHYYYTLNDEGIEYLRKKLGITGDEVKPATRKPRFDLLKDNDRRRGRGRGMRGGRGAKRFGDKGGDRGRERGREGGFNRGENTENAEPKQPANVEPVPEVPQVDKPEQS